MAAKLETAVAYILLAPDIFRDIQDQLGGQHARMRLKIDFVNEAVTVVKRGLSSSSSTAQSSQQSRKRDSFPNRRATLQSNKLTLATAARKG